jgi:hypothetical protein
MLAVYAEGRPGKGVAVKAKFAGSRCPLCLGAVAVGSEIEKFMGRWVHIACTSAEGRTSVPRDWKWRGIRIPQGGNPQTDRGKTRGGRGVA